MADDIFDILLGSELSLMFFISIIVWFLIFVFLFYTINKVRSLERELNTLKDQ
ncbi:MAG: CcmD family protein [Candidatus Hodarchaeales archaeon]